MTLFTNHINALDSLISHGLEMGYNVLGLIDRRDAVEEMRHEYSVFLRSAVEATDTL